jgi:hypothetical protein
LEWVLSQQALKRSDIAIFQRIRSREAGAKLINILCGYAPGLQAALKFNDIVAVLI